MYDFRPFSHTMTFGLFPLNQVTYMLTSNGSRRGSLHQDLLPDFLDAYVRGEYKLPVTVTWID
jgi:hypothetical protein